MSKNKEYMNHGLIGMDTDKNTLPEGWEWKNIREVCEVINGGTPKSSIKEYWNGDVNWVTPKDLGKLKNRYIDILRKLLVKLPSMVCKNHLQSYFLQDQ